MRPSSFLKSPLRVALLACVAGIGFTAAASAQDYDGRYGPPPPPPSVYDNNAPDEIVIYAPRHHRVERGDLGGPIEDVSLSKGVRYDDLDLTTDWGIRKLHDRIAFTARELCRRLDMTHPIAVSDSPPCYRTAMEQAGQLAIAAIDRANERAEGRTYQDRRYYRYDDGRDGNY